MATLIVYPDPDYNTWISSAEADVLASNSLYEDKWVALTDDEKSKHLIHAFLFISNLEGFIGPDGTIPDDIGCLGQAQVDIILQDLRYSISSTLFDPQVVKRQTAGPVEIEYFESSGGPQIVDRIPDITWKCLEVWGVVPSTSLPFISTIRKHR